MDKTRSVQLLLLNILNKEMRQRKNRLPEECILAERNAMFVAVNQQLKLLKKTPMPMATLERIENSSIGDGYADKYTRRCAEVIVYGFIEI